MFFSIFLTCVVALDITISKNGLKYDVLKNGAVGVKFQEETFQQSQCHPSVLYGESMLQEFSLFTLNNTSDQPINIELNPISMNTDAVLLKFEKNQLKINDKSHQEFKIEYECLASQQLTWSLINIKINVNDEKHELYYFKLCKQAEQYLHPLIILLILAISLVVLGSQYGMKEFRLFGNVQQEEFGLATAGLFIVSASIVLLLLFKFPEIGQIILTVFVTIVSFIAIETVILDTLNSISQHIKINTVMAYTTGAIIITSYIMSKNWLLSNILALSITLLMFRIIEIDCFKTGCLLLSLAFIYDIFWVFISPYIFGESVMATVATSIDLPMKFMCPSLINPQNTPLLKCSLLGLGDILLPGIIIKYCLKFELLLNRGYSIFVAAIIGYSFGLGTCILSLIIYQTAQPALLYIVPSLLLCVLGMSCKKGVFFQLWQGEVLRVGTAPPRVEHAYELTSEQL